MVLNLMRFGGMDHGAISNGVEVVYTALLERVYRYLYTAFHRAVIEIIQRVVVVFEEIHTLQYDCLGLFGTATLLLPHRRTLIMFSQAAFASCHSDPAFSAFRLSHPIYGWRGRAFAVIQRSIAGRYAPA